MSVSTESRSDFIQFRATAVADNAACLIGFPNYHDLGRNTGIHWPVIYRRRIKEAISDLRSMQKSRKSS